MISFNKELLVYVDGNNLKGVDIPSSSTCHVWFGEKSELSITILCNYGCHNMCKCFAFVGVTMNSFDMSLLEIMLVSIRFFEEYYVSCTMLSYK